MNDWPAAVILTSEQPLLLQRALTEVKALVPPGMEAFNLDVVDAKVGVARILSLAQTLPMMAARRVVVVRDLQTLPAAELIELEPYFRAPVPTTCLVAVASKIDKRLKFWAQATKAGWVRELAAPRQLEAWVQAEAKASAVPLAPGAAARLVEVVGDDMARLASTLEQLGLFCQGQAVTVAAVETLIATTRERSVFELTDLLLAGDVAGAQAMVRRLLEQRESAIGILAILARHARNMLKAQASGRTSGLAAVLGVPPFVADKYAAAAKARPISPTVTALIASTDAGLKGGVAPAPISARAVKSLGRPLAEALALQVVVDALAQR